jgi:muramoyltetrapeptide carboxypeptidase
MSKSMPGTVPSTEERTVRKPKALPSGSFLQAFAPASPGNADAVTAGLKELVRLGFRVGAPVEFASEGYFAGSKTGRGEELSSGLANQSVDGLVAVRGGYGSNYLLDELKVSDPTSAKLILGYSDLTSLQIYFWEQFGWVTIYGPMIAAGIAAGPGAPKGYDRESLQAALQQPEAGWRIELRGESLGSGIAEGRILGGCMTLVETTLGTPWELDTRGSILLLEDRGMKPWQVDRALMHLKQAGKFESAKGILLGDFPECEPPVAGSPTVQEVCRRILTPLGVPIIFGAPVGHTMRPMLTVPLGVNARLIAKGEGFLEILEPAVTA